MSAPDLTFLVIAGVLAGVIGTAGGITSLVSYPALLAVGVSTFDANVANLVASLACWPASALASRLELREVRAVLPAGLVAAALGGAAGTGALLLTPAVVFDHVVPILVATGAMVLLIQPRLTAWSERRGGHGRLVGALVVGAISVYSGYFGAGSGVMLLAATLVLMNPRVPEANACKNMFLGASATTSAFILVAVASPPWSAVAPLAVGLFLGSIIGPVVARTLPARFIRWAVAVLGFALAAELLLGGAF